MNTIQNVWESYAADSLREASKAQLRTLRVVYFAGAIGIHKIIGRVGEAGLSEEAEQAIFDGIAQELTDFMSEVG